MVRRHSQGRHLIDRVFELQNIEQKILNFEVFHFCGRNSLFDYSKFQIFLFGIGMMNVNPWEG